MGSVLSNVAPFTYIDLFAGVSMLGQGFEAGCRHLGVETRCLCHVEGEVYAAQVLASRMSEGSLAEAPVYSDVRTFRGRKLRGYVDALVGGFPCQDLSVAGKREGIGGGKSGLWEQFRRLIREIEPGIVYIENVPGLSTSLTLLHRGEIVGHLAGILRAAEAAATPRERWYLERHHDRLYWRLLKIHGIPALLYVQACLGEMDYESETGFFSAAEVGPPHKRERVFILAYDPQLIGRGKSISLSRRTIPASTGTGGADLGDTGLQHGIVQQRINGAESSRASLNLADSSNGLIQEQGRGPEGRAGVIPASEVMGDTTSSRPSGREPGSSGQVWDEARRQESSGRCDSVAEPISARRETTGIGCDIDAGREPQEGCGSVANACESGLERWQSLERDVREGRATAERIGGSVEFPKVRYKYLPDSIGLHDDDAGHGTSPVCGERSTAPELLFPPGPSDRDAWSRMPAHLAPAIEPGFRLHVDDDAVVVDASRTDQLRCGGNGVVALTAGLAFVTLARKAGIA